MLSIDSASFKDKKVLIRVDYNVPMDDNQRVTDDTRIKGTLPTIHKILNQGGSVILMSHIGRPKGLPTEKYSMKHVIPALEKLLGMNVSFVPDCIGLEVEEAAKNLRPGDILLLENLRFHAEEEKGDVNFAEKLAKLGDMYINDAFGTAHRAHASTTIIAKFFPENKLFGYLMKKELESIDQVLHHARRPFTAILGGAKVSSKISIIENLLNKVDHLIIGGGMMFTFIRAMGGKTGASMVEEDKIDLAKNLIESAKQKGIKLHIPVDAIAGDQFSNEAKTMTCPSDQIPDGWMGLDIGPETIRNFSEIIHESKTILWNGPLGVFEMESFAEGTKEIGESITIATKTGSFSLVGGGDSVAAVNKFGMADKVSYVSTGGGALLEYMEGIELPGVKAIRD